jgi:hypothetical protein
LHEHIRSIRIGANQLVDQCLGIPVLLRRAVIAHTLEETGDELAFLCIHGIAPWVRDEQHIGCA